ncbi:MULTISPECIES: transporter substrate-binding domain-containing protein [unclassified Pseudomonas]|uniref:transporter substrate-binding domain-containing protein n=1 Tax=unclassified Pseudomonas TaxID=196821 RepID=UPI00087149A3|nr:MULTISPECIES: transporter substrate-binding domain-containing protein [unclassified Pseudomonas]SCW29270.1 amino acid ABC transporter substrate-binding protein, PAAT family (TC 3.A.1.3.-) [Pseudomonas sp. NFACC56-3]SFK11065.1 amino acid ABC transporter substrate-binding protein, PAAT family (TC 3.A.1.3.-) [Pseudomonas sp. NFACC52]
MNALNTKLAATFTPTGVLRASINVGNPILACLDEAGHARGVSVDLATAFAAELGLPLELRVFKSAGESVTAVCEGQADFGFFAIDPVRAEQLAFTAPYVLIEGCYLVRDDSPLKGIDQVDQPGIELVVGKGSAYDLHLTRELKHATIIRSPTSPTVVETFLAEGAAVAAGVKQQLAFDAQRFPGLRLLPGRFMEIRQAMGIPQAYGREAAERLRHFVEWAKASGFVAEALQRHGIQGATVAP